MMKIKVDSSDLENQYHGQREREWEQHSQSDELSPASLSHDGERGLQKKTSFQHEDDTITAEETDISTTAGSLKEPVSVSTTKSLFSATTTDSDKDYFDRCDVVKTMHEDDTITAEETDISTTAGTVVVDPTITTTTATTTKSFQLDGMMAAEYEADIPSKKTSDVVGAHSNKEEIVISKNRDNNTFISRTTSEHEDVSDMKKNKDTNEVEEGLETAAVTHTIKGNYIITNDAIEKEKEKAAREQSLSKLATATPTTTHTIRGDYIITNDEKEKEKEKAAREQSRSKSTHTIRGDYIITNDEMEKEKEKAAREQSLSKPTHTIQGDYIITNDEKEKEKAARDQGRSKPATHTVQGDYIITNDDVEKEKAKAARDQSLSKPTHRIQGDYIITNDDEEKEKAKAARDQSLSKPTHTIQGDYIITNDDLEKEKAKAARDHSRSKTMITSPTSANNTGDGGDAITSVCKVGDEEVKVPSLSRLLRDGNIGGDELDDGRAKTSGDTHEIHGDFIVTKDSKSESVDENIEENKKKDINSKEPIASTHEIVGDYIVTGKEMDKKQKDLDAETTSANNRCHDDSVTGTHRIVGDYVVSDKDEKREEKDAMQRKGEGVSGSTATATHAIVGDYVMSDKAKMKEKDDKGEQQLNSTIVAICARESAGMAPIQPGAVAVPGIQTSIATASHDNDYYNDDDNDELVATTTTTSAAAAAAAAAAAVVPSPSSPNCLVEATSHTSELSSDLVPVETVDDSELASRYKVPSREEIEARMRKEYVKATELKTMNDDYSTIERPFCRKFSKVITVAGVILIIAIIAIVALVLSLMEKRPQPTVDTTITEAPSASSTLSDFAYVQEMLYDVSGDAIFNESSTQYRALEWLVNDDSAMLNLKDTAISSFLVERYVLALFFFATGESDFLKRLGFLSNTSICDWNSGEEVGVSCGYQGVAKIMKCDDMELNGTIPSELSEFKSLEKLSLYNNYLSGTIPEAFGELRNLDMLQLSLNYLTGALPSSLSNLTLLRRFYTTYNSLTGTVPDFLTKMSTLRDLWLTSNQLHGTIPQNWSTPFLNTLIFYDNLLEGTIPDSIFDASDMVLLDVGLNNMTGTIPSRISDLSFLEILYMDGNQFSGTLPTSLFDCEYLVELYLNENNFVGTIPAEIGKLLDANMIHLNQNQLTGTLPSEFGLLTQLMELQISQNNFIETIPSTFSMLTNLDLIDFSNNTISGFVDDIFCDLSSDENVFIVADCKGPNPEVNCSCCSSCCDDASGDCYFDQQNICENSAMSVESGKIFGDDNLSNVCSCTDDGTSFTCGDSNCLTCTEDATICGISTDYGYGFDGDGIPNYWKFSFKYLAGLNDTITIEKFDPLAEIACKAYVNGRECTSCGLSHCKTEFLGIRVTCLNVIDDDGGLFDTCLDYQSGSHGVFEALNMYYRNTWTGCIPAFEPFHWLTP